ASVVVLGSSVWGVRVVNTINELRVLAPQLRMVHAQSASRSPFSTFDFIETYARYNEYFPEPGSLDLCVACAFSGNELVGYVALKRVRDHVGPVGYTKLEFLCTHDSELPEIVARAGDEERVSTVLIEYLLEHEPGFAMLELKEQRAGSPILTNSLGSSAFSGFYARTFASLDVATVNIRWSTLADYFWDFNKKFRSNVSRQVRKLAALDDVELLSARHPADLEPIFELYLDLERRSWKAQAAGVIGRHPKRVAFFRDLVAKAAPFELSFDILCVRGLPIAGIVNGRHERNLYALQIVYDEDFRDNGPGVLMLLWSMKRAIEQKLSAYHLLHGSAYYKTRWLADVTSTESMQYFRVGTAAHLRARLGEARRWMGSLQPEAFAALKYNLDKRRVLTQSRPALSAEAHETSRALVNRVKQMPGTVVNDGAAIAAAMPFQV
ncbi:MAG TPA: GNAT family N-acetyltransferase, partial [Myxococcota bacterium]|nr:GNAT family N-acetyltransferase [Myxococcota bacterium]